MIRQSSRIIWSLSGLVLFFVGWELAAAHIASINPRGHRIFPSWTEILTTNVRDLGTFVPFGSTSTGYSAALEVLVHHSLVTLCRVLIGTTSGIALGIAIGLAMVYTRWVFYILNPLLTLARVIPLLALIPLFILWFNGSELGIDLYIAFAVFVMIFVAAYHAAANVPHVPQRFARTMGASRRTMFRTVVMPGMVPELFAQVRIVCALSWSFALGAEFTGAQEGLGFLMIQSERFGYLGRVVAVVLLFTIYAVLVDALLVALRGRFLRWVPSNA